jgi:hypothetical protein
MVAACLSFVSGAVLFLVVLWDAFESIVLPRRVTRKLRLTRIFYRTTWQILLTVSRLASSAKTRESMLGYYGPISLLLLLVIWAWGLVISFALLHYSAGSAITMVGFQPGFATDLYLSGTTFFTLGLGDVVPRSTLARAFTVAEAGLGFGFLAIVIGYLPVIYQSFSRREVNISLLDARAGSPPCAGELLRRHAYPHGIDALQDLLATWEHWSADLMESHLSYPVLAFFRSQHDNQSWIASLTTILDACALVMMGLEGACQRQAELTFAIARHAVVDLSQTFYTPPTPVPYQRLDRTQLTQLRDVLAREGMKLHEGGGADARLTELRALYEPYVYALSSYLHLPLPRWLPAAQGQDNWQTSAWAQASGLLQDPLVAGLPDDHS